MDVNNAGNIFWRICVFCKYCRLEGKDQVAGIKINSENFMAWDFRKKVPAFLDLKEKGRKLSNILHQPESDEQSR
jgi:ribosomal protein L44E